ncbi:hypothetical protein [Roseomonas populi]|uniref:Uncharacterized protein n=1 Tax=Roseomonas populi TaxID=3121582 RepID=A0ABT1WXR4_9PROT|nr:hypothetical protein [Roseomonas pecuniae]MCR0980618.1 hypothetical protein [Roseomonas pecuniae]
MSGKEEEGSSPERLSGVQSLLLDRVATVMNYQIAVANYVGSLYNVLPGLLEKAGLQNMGPMKESSALISNNIKNITDTLEVLAKELVELRNINNNE